MPGTNLERSPRGGDGSRSTSPQGSRIDLSRAQYERNEKKRARESDGETDTRTPKAAKKKDTSEKELLKDIQENQDLVNLLQKRMTINDTASQKAYNIIAAINSKFANHLQDIGKKNLENLLQDPVKEENRLILDKIRTAINDLRNTAETQQNQDRGKQRNPIEHPQDTAPSSQDDTLANIFDFNSHYEPAKPQPRPEGSPSSSKGKEVELISTSLSSQNTDNQRFRKNIIDTAPQTTPQTHPYQDTSQPIETYPLQLKNGVVHDHYKVTELNITKWSYSSIDNIPAGGTILVDNSKTLAIHVPHLDKRQKSSAQYSTQITRIATGTDELSTRLSFLGLMNNKRKSTHGWTKFR